MQEQLEQSELSSYDKFIVKHLNALKWLESLQRDYEANGFNFPLEFGLASLKLQTLISNMEANRPTAEKQGAN